MMGRGLKLQPDEEDSVIVECSSFGMLSAVALTITLLAGLVYFLWSRG